MDAIETLMNEHRVIERVCDALVGFADEARRKGTTDKDELGRFVTFIREFADRCHHGKEEDILFKAMVAHGFPTNGGPIAVMLHEHGEGRALVGSLAAKTAQDAAWTPADLQEIVDDASAYSNLLHAHIHKEDAILYPMAEARLAPEAMEQVGVECERFEQKQIGAGEHERYHALADELVRRHAATSHPAADATTSHGHGHGCCG